MIEKYKALEAENERFKALNVELTAKCNWYNSDGARLERERDELRRDAERYRKLRDEDAWGEDTSESGGSRWGELGEMHGAAFDAVVDALPSNA